MKNVIVLFLTAALLLLSACSPSNTADTDNINIDLAVLANDLLDSDLFEEELNQVDGEAAEKIYDITNASASYLYAGSGAVADELALFEFEQAEDAQAAVELAEARVTTQTESFATYIPAEVPKLDHAVIKTFGRYLVVCVSDQPKAGEIISEYFK